MISIDACFLSKRYQGRLLVACGYDAENQLLPLAFAIVEKEHSDTWGFFMRWLQLEVTGDGRFFCVISDRHLAIKFVFQDPYLRWYEDTDLCVHRYCAHHVAENLYKYVGRKREVSDRFKIGVNKRKPRRLQEMFEDFQIRCPEAIQYLNKVCRRDPDDEDEPACPEKKSAGPCIEETEGSVAMHKYRYIYVTTTPPQLYPIGCSKSPIKSRYHRVFRFRYGHGT